MYISNPLRINSLHFVYSINLSFSSQVNLSRLSSLKYKFILRREPTREIECKNVLVFQMSCFKHCIFSVSQFFNYIFYFCILHFAFLNFPFSVLSYIYFFFIKNCCHLSFFFTVVLALVPFLVPLNEIISGSQFRL